jgi:hypothetical protein
VKMKRRLLLIALALVFSALSFLIGQSNVGALGAPSDNTTVPNSPAGDQSQAEIKPPVEYVLRGPTSQTETTPPNLIAGFVTTSNQKEPTVTGDESWYLDLDINAPGWIYIYEYFPPGQSSQGQWLAYKWQLPASGLWRLGPFVAKDNEPEGQHMYRLWFHSDGEWAAGNPETPQSRLIYWTYRKVQAAEPSLPPSSAAPSTEADSLPWILQPLVLGTCLLVVIAGLVWLVVYFWRRRGREHLSKANETAPIEPSTIESSAPALAKLALPNGLDIRLSGDTKVIGRSHLARVLSLDDLGLVSRRHFGIKLEDEQFYIEDLGSANGTRLNGKDIGGRGPVSLDDGDVIEPAGVVSLKFHLL